MSTARERRGIARCIHANFTKRLGIDPKRNAAPGATGTAYFKTQQSNHASNSPMAQCHGGNGIHAALRYEALKSSWIRSNPLCTSVEYRATMNEADRLAFCGEA